MASYQMNNAQPRSPAAAAQVDPVSPSTSPRTLQQRLDEARTRYEARTPASKALHEKAVCSLPGGNTRTLLFTRPWPISLASGQGSCVVDEDGNIYTDLTGELTAGLYGHSNQVIIESIKSTLDNVGMNLGGTTAQEARYAQLLCSRFNLERVRFANSGTEANLHALAAARHYTSKRKVVVFEGGYHGAVLTFGHGVAPNNVDHGDWVLAKYNDIASAQAAIEQTDAVAAVIVEGMQGSGGCIPGTPEFLLAVQTSAKKAGAVFILDEVMTSRVAPGGLHSSLGLSPDLITLGKYLGGGLAFGAFGGKAEVMGVYDPRLENSLAHSGTFNNNTLAMNAGYTGLTEEYTPAKCISFSADGDRLRSRLNSVSKGTKCTWTGLGTLMNSHFTENGDEAELLTGMSQEIVALKDLFWMDMLEQGFWVTRRGMLALILGTPQREIDRFVGAVASFLDRHGDLVRSAIPQPGDTRMTRSA